jgi:hypothetical protein
MAFERGLSEAEVIMSRSPKPIAPNPRPIDPGVSIGHVHLKVADLNRAFAFYCGVLGFDLMQRYGDDAAFLSAGGYHHYISLNTWESKGGVAAAIGKCRRQTARRCSTCNGMRYLLTVACCFGNSVRCPR